MGIVCSRFCSEISAKRTLELRIGVHGLTNAGKTSILHLLVIGHNNIEPTPTSGLYIQSFALGKYLLNFWEVAGVTHTKNRMLWQHYNQNTRAIIFVVDSTDIKRIPEVTEALQWLCFQPELSEAIFLLFANKNDLPDALTDKELAGLLNLSTILAHHVWTITSCSALTGNGVIEGLQQLLEMYELALSNKNICISCRFKRN